MIYNLLNYIPKEDLHLGYYYVCHARNFVVGMWNGSGFEYDRYKFGNEFKDVEYHYDDELYPTVMPLVLCNNLYTVKCSMCTSRERHLMYDGKYYCLSCLFKLGLSNADLDYFNIIKDNNT